MLCLGFSDGLLRVLPDGLFCVAHPLPQGSLTHQFCAVCALGAYIFVLYLVELAMYKGMDFGPRRLSRPFYRAGLFGRFLFRQLFFGLIQLFARFSMRSLDAAVCSCWLFCRNFVFGDFGTLCPEVAPLLVLSLMGHILRAGG